MSLTACSDSFKPEFSLSIVVPEVVVTSHAQMESVSLQNIQLAGLCGNADSVRISGDVSTPVYVVDCTNGNFIADVALSNSFNIKNLVFAAILRSFEGNPTDLVIDYEQPFQCGGLAIQTCSIGGNGEPATPYMVNSISCLQELRDGLTCHYELASNIDASSANTLNSGSGWLGIAGFNGFLDGNNHTVSNLTASSGLFTTSSLDISISNLTLDNFNISAGGFETAALIDQFRDATLNISNINILNSTLDASWNNGMLIGQLYNSSGTITDVTISNGSVTGSSFNTGGLIGQVFGGTPRIENIIVRDMVITGSTHTGGLVGEVQIDAVLDAENIDLENLTVTGSSLTGSILGVLKINSIFNYTNLGVVNSSVNGTNPGDEFGNVSNDSQANPM